MAATAKPYSAAKCRARATSRDNRLCKPPLWPLRISGAGADPGVHRTPGISPRSVLTSVSTAPGDAIVQAVGYDGPEGSWNPLAMRNG